jgi:hypothetical protein
MIVCYEAQYPRPCNSDVIDSSTHAEQSTPRLHRIITVTQSDGRASNDCQSIAETRLNNLHTSFQ